MEQWWAPHDLPIFQLVPQTFDEQANILYNNLGHPVVSSTSFWDIYKQLLSAFRALPAFPPLDEVVSAAAEVVEEEVPLLPGLRDLCYGNDGIWDLGYLYYGGLSQPPALPLSTDNDDIEEIELDLREYVDFSDYFCNFTPNNCLQSPRLSPNIYLVSFTTYYFSDYSN